MANVVRVEYEVLAEVASRLSAEADQARKIGARLGQAADNLKRTAWTGKGADAFYREVEGNILPAYRRLETALKEASTTLKALSQMFQQAEQEAASYLNTLRQHKTPLLYNYAIVGASGADHVEQARIARLDRSGAPIPGTEKQFDVDAVCLGYGLLPSFHLTAAFGCKLRFDQGLGWWAPEHNEKMETSQPGIFVAGDVTDIAGAQVALVEGQIAGLQAAHQLGALDAESLASRLPTLRARLRKLNRLAGALQQIFVFRPGLVRAASDDTVLCRCEEITVGQVKKALANGAVDLHQVKLATRTGMGYCQGRFCSILAAPLIAEATGQPLANLLPFTVRPPNQPIPLSVLGSAVVVHQEP